MPFRRRLLLVAAALTLLSACSGPQPADDPAPAPAPEEETEPTLSAPTFERLVIDESGLVLLDQQREVVLPGVSFGGFLAHEAGQPIFTAQTADSTHLLRAEPSTGRLHTLHAASSTPVYSIARAPTSPRVAFAYRNGQSGDVMIAESGALADPGCSASTQALHWPDAGTLVTGDGSNQYVVSPSNCATQATLDIRKMHHIRYAPGRSRMAYIFRDLVYDRANRAYVPDSSLYVANLDGTDADELFDSSYKPRHLAWSPDGSTLAFDVRLNEPPHRRRIVLHENGRSSYLVAPTDFPQADVVKPVWSPSGRNVAFDLVRERGTAKAVRAFGRTQLFNVDADSTWGWIDDDTIVFVTRTDSTKAYSVDGDVVFSLGPSTTLIDAVRTEGAQAGSPPAE